MLIRLVRVAGVLLLLVGGALDCASGQRDTKPAATAPAQAGFTITLSYSKKAMDTLGARKETVIVAGYLYGFPKQGTPKRYVDEIGQVDAGEVKDEIVPGAPATFDHIKLDQAMTKWFDSQGPQLLINVYSGRKSSPNNLLDCGLYEGSLKAIQGQTIPISCKLIGE
jgi:hypothetical protein